MNTAGLSPRRFSHSAMGTIFEAVLVSDDEDYARQAALAFFSEVDRLEGLFSRFNPCSEIGQINLLAAGQSLTVSIDVYECLDRALQLQEQTEGAFDINFRQRKNDGTGSISTRLRSESKASTASISLSRSPTGFKVKAKTNLEKAETAGLDLDLGGIGKGFALEKSLELFADWNIKDALIHAGTSSVVAVGDAPDSAGSLKGWPVGIGGNWPCLKDKRLFLENRSLSGSGTEVKGEHIFDPRQGRSASGHLAAWVSHPSAAVADALSTAFTVMERNEVEEFCQQNPETWALVLIDPDRYEVYNEELIGERQTGLKS